MFIGGETTFTGVGIETGAGAGVGPTVLFVEIAEEVEDGDDCAPVALVDEPAPLVELPIAETPDAVDILD